VERGALGIPGSDQWPVVLITPGETPLHQLAAALSRPAGQPAAEIAGRLRADPASLGEVLTAVLASRAALSVRTGPAVSTGRVVLLADQLCQALRGPSLARQWAALHAGIGPPPC
jgi:hypothetical protein